MYTQISHVAYVDARFSTFDKELFPVVRFGSSHVGGGWQHSKLDSSCGQRGNRATFSHVDLCLNMSDRQGAAVLFC
jgi:hypothetical protein